MSKKSKSKKKKKEHRAFVTALTVISSSFALVCYGVFLAASLAQDMGTQCYLLGGAGTLLSALALVLMGKYPYGLRKFICFGMTVFMLSFGGFAVYTNFCCRDSLPQRSDFTLIVFGAHTNGLMPGRTLITRLNTAVLLLEDNPEAVCIVSGAQGANESAAEADAMRKYLVERGIDDTRIYCEYRASDTLQNLGYSAEIIEREGLESHDIVLCSSAYHIPRIRFAAEHYVGGIYGGRTLYCAGSVSRTVYYFVSDNLREYMAWVKLLGRIGIEKAVWLYDYGAMRIESLVSRS